MVSGPHLGQRFRLEPTAESKDDVFKIGRSTGKLFKEKGVSLYKDKETSTTHAKVGRFLRLQCSDKFHNFVFVDRVEERTGIYCRCGIHKWNITQQVSRFL